MAGMSIGELFVKLGFQADQTKLREFVQSLGDVNVQSLAASVGLGGLYDAAQKVMHIAEENSLQMRAFADETGYSAQKMQQWVAWAASLGVNAGTVIGSLKGLEDQVARMKITGEYSSAWALLGIDPTTAKDSFELLTMLRDAVLRLRPEVQRLALQQLGLSDSLLTLFKAGTAEWDQLGQLITNTNSQTEAINRNYGAWNKLGGEWKVVLTDLAAKAAPFLRVLAEILDGFVRIIHASPALQALLIGLTAAVGALGVALALVASAAWASGLAPLILGLSALFGIVVGLVTWLGHAKEAIRELAESAKSTFANSPLGLLGGALFESGKYLVGGQPAGNTTTKHNEFNIAIHGKDPEEIHKKVREAISDALEDTDGLSYAQSY